MCDPVTATIGAAVVGGGAAVAGAKSQSKAVKQAAETQADASAANIAAAEAERARNEVLFRPEIDRGARADSYLDALYYGDAPAPVATPVFYASRSAPYSGGGIDWQAYYNSGLGSEFETGFVGTPNGGTRRSAWAEQARRETDGSPEAVAQHYWNAWGQRQGHTLPTLAQTQAQAAQVAAQSAPAAPITRADVLAQIEANPINQIGADAYTGAMTEAGRARSDLQGVADTAYGDRLSLLEQDYLKRQGFTDAEVRAWEANASVARDRAVDSAVSRFGITGQTGNVARNIGQTEQDYARDRAQYEAGKRREDYEPLSTGRMLAYDDKANAYTNAANNFANASTRALDERTASKYSAYGDWLDYMNGQSSRGQSGRGAVAGAGQTTLGITNAQRSNAANAMAQGMYDGANVKANMYNSLAQTAGQAYGQWQTANKNPVLMPTQNKASYMPTGSYGQFTPISSNPVLRAR